MPTNEQWSFISLHENFLFQCCDEYFVTPTAAVTSVYILGTLVMGDTYVLLISSPLHF